MVYVKWVVVLTFWLCVGAMLNYSLPQYDTVRIVNTYEERQDLGDWTRIFWSRPDQQSENLASRDVQFVQGVRPDGESIVYRNEDTGWSWPPYFKFDTADLYTQANDAISTKDAPEWVLVKHYGWRIPVLSVFPNAIAIRPTSNVDDQPINWVSIAILTALAAVFWAIYVRWLRFRRRRIDPLVETVEDGFYSFGDEISERVRKIGRWFKK